MRADGYDNYIIGWSKLSYLSPLVMGYENSDKLIVQLADELLFRRFR